MKTIRPTILFIFAFLVAAYSISPAVDYQMRRAAVDDFAANYPQTQFYHDGTRLARIYGQPFGSGASPTETAEMFRTTYAPMLGVGAGELLPESYVIRDGNVQPIMYLKETGAYKFTLVYYSQYKDGIPVYLADLRLLVRNEPGYPLVLAASSLRDLGDFQVEPSAASADPLSIQQAFAAISPQYTQYTEPRKIIWAGVEGMKVEPRVGVEFVAADAPHATIKYRYILDALTGEILYQEDQLIDVDVIGSVQGNATENFRAEQCGNEIPTVHPWARVYIQGGSVAFADSAGNFVIPNGGSSPVTVVSYVRGRWFQVWNQAGSESYLSQSVTPPGPVDFLHNQTNGEFTRAEVNGYVHANVVRDYTLRYNPSYPTIYNQTDFPVYVNDNTGYCPGNAWYDGVSITFCRAASGYPNTAFSTVVHHEYGHHLVEMGGSGQGEYGEGMGDVMGLLITDDPGAAWGFYGPCNQALRNADNGIQYPCSGEIHYCGQLLSGCVWETRNELAITNPTTYRSIISNLAINAILLHTGTSITPSITIDYLTLDDDDGNIDNGTPHHSEICAGFGSHNMDCPPLNLLGFNYPNGLPEFVHPFGGTTVRVEVYGIAQNPQPNTGQLHYNGGAGWVTIAMTQISPNVYDAVFPAFTCRTSVNYYFSAQTTQGNTVNDPQNAPSVYYTTISATGVVALYNDDFASNQGWTGLGGSGEWTIGISTGGSGSDGYGGPDPAVDHSPSSNNRVLGNDLTSGSGGDYSANLGSTYWVTSPTINCSGYYNISLSFYRWLGVEGNTYDHAYFQVYNGSSWVTLFSNGSVTVDESAWSENRYNVSSYADNNSNFRIRFGIGATDGAWQYCGWNIDDIRLTSPLCDTIQNGTIIGIVSDSHGPVNGAFVHAVGGAGNAWDTTASNGSYSVVLPPDTYSVTFTHVDHRDTSAAGIVVIAGDTTTLNMVMQRLPGTVKGTVTKAPSNPAPEIRVIVQGAGKEDTTDSGGFYRINGITDGAYSIQFTNPDYRDTTIGGVNITPGDTTTLNVQMQQLPGWIAGTVGDSSGAPIESVLVSFNTGFARLKRVDGKFVNDDEGLSEELALAIDSVYTDVSGHYSSRLNAATYNVNFRRTDYYDTTVAGVQVTPNDTSVVSPTLRRYNHPPVITSPPSATATEDILFSYVATAMDSDSVTPVISLSDYPVWMSVLGDTISGTPLEGTGDTSFRIIASDGYLADTQVVAVTVLPVNDPPYLTSLDTATAVEHQAFAYVGTAGDPDGTTPVIGFFAYPIWLSPSGAQISGVPPEAADDTSFGVIASDGTYADSMTVSVTIIHFDDPPVITSPSSAEATEDIPFAYVATAFDPEGALTTISFDSYPSWMSVLGDTVSGTPLEGYPDTSFRIIASDGALNDTMIVNVNVTPVNDAPYVTSLDTATAVEDELFTYLASAADPDGTTPTIAFVAYPSWMTPSGNTISGTPLEGDLDTSFAVIASDGSLADTLVVQVTVIPVNDAPVVTSADSVSAVEGELFIYVATASDPDGTLPVLSFTDFAFWLTVHGDSLIGTTPVGAPDTTFEVIASDGSLADTQLVTVTIHAPNQPPHITSPASGAAIEDEMFEYLAAAVDPDSTVPTIAIINVPSWMTVADSYVSGTPLEGYADTSFVVTASDGFLADTLEVQIDVIPVNDPPYVTSQAVDTATVDVPYAYVGTAEDPDGTVPAIAFADYPSWLIAVDNNLLGVPPLGASDTSFVVIASDEEFADSLFVTLYVTGGCDYVPGDVNGNGEANGVDITYSVNFFKGFGEAPSSLCPCPPHADLYVSGDVNSNCLFNGVDITFFVNFLKGVGPELGFCADCPPGGPAKTGNGKIGDHSTSQVQDGK